MFLKVLQVLIMLIIFLTLNYNLNKLFKNIESMALPIQTQNQE